MQDQPGWVLSEIGSAVQMFIVGKRHLRKRGRNIVLLHESNLTRQLVRMPQVVIIKKSQPVALCSVCARVTRGCLPQVRPCRKIFIRLSVMPLSTSSAERREQSSTTISSRHEYVWQRTLCTA